MTSKPERGRPGYRRRWDPDDPEPDDLLTPAEARDLLRVSRPTLLKYEDMGLLAPVRLPGATGDRRYRRRELLGLLSPAPRVET